MKKIVIIIISLIFLSNIHSNEWSYTKNNMKEPIEFLSKYDSIVRYIDYSKFPLQEYTKRVELLWKSFLEEYFINNDYLRAKKLLEDIIYYDRKQNGKLDNYLVGFYLVKTLKILEENFRFEKYLEKEAEEYSNEYITQYMYGYLLYFNKKYDVARFYILKSLRIKDDFYLGHNLLGNIFSKQKDYENALKEYFISFNLKPDYEIPIFNIGIDYLNQNRPIQASIYFDHALKINPYNENIKNTIILLKNRYKFNYDVNKLFRKIEKKGYKKDQKSIDKPLKINFDKITFLENAEKINKKYLIDEYKSKNSYSAMIKKEEIVKGNENYLIKDIPMKIDKKEPKKIEITEDAQDYVYEEIKKESKIVSHFKKYKNTYINSSLFIGGIIFLKNMTDAIDDINKKKDSGESTSSATTKRNVNFVLSGSCLGTFFYRVYF